MRKSLKLTVGVVLVSIFTAIAICKSNNHTSQLENLLLENIEALADDEYQENVRCAGSGSVDCPVNHTKVKYVGSGLSD